MKKKILFFACLLAMSQTNNTTARSNYRVVVEFEVGKRAVQSVKEFWNYFFGRSEKKRREQEKKYVFLYLKQALVGVLGAGFLYTAIQNVKCVLELFRSFSWKGFFGSVAVYLSCGVTYVYTEKNKILSNSEKIGSASFAVFCLQIYAHIFHSVFSMVLFLINLLIVILAPLLKYS